MRTILHQGRPSEGGSWLAIPDACLATYKELGYETRDLVLRDDAEQAIREAAQVSKRTLSAKHEAIIRKAAQAVANRGHEGDAKLADSLLGVLASLTSAGAA